VKYLILEVFRISRAWYSRVFINQSLEFLVLFIKEVFFSSELFKFGPVRCPRFLKELRVLLQILEFLENSFLDIINLLDTS